MKINIFIDLDGVLADFLLYVRKMYGLDLKLKTNHHNKNFERAKSQMWQDIEKHPEFWSNLPILPDALELWKFFEPLNPIILTAAPKNYGLNSKEFQNAAKHKALWVKNHLAMNDSSRFICTFSNQKFLHMVPGEINVLIDDMTPVISSWMNHGGIGILHKNTKKSVVLYEQKINVIKHQCLKS